MNGTERVILIKGDATKWYDQVIFIMNKNLPKEKIPVDFVQEAEKIIQAYIAGNKKEMYMDDNKKATTVVANVKPAKFVKPARDKRFDFFLNLVMLLGCLVIAGVFLMGWL